MLRHPVLFGAVLFLWHCGCMDLPAGEKAEKTSPPTADATDWRGKLELALDKRVSVDFEEQPLNEVVEYLREQAGVTILVDVRALDDVGLPFDSPVSGKFSDMPLRSVLRHSLREFDLTWTLRDGALVITTPEEAECCMETRVYDVLDLVRLNDQSAPDEYDYHSIISLITTTIAPQSWDTVGGPGSIEAFRGGVVISQTPDILGQVNDVLAIFRKAKKIAEEHTCNAPPTVSIDFYEDDPAVVRIERALETPMTFDFVETALHDVAEFIATKCQINVVLDRRALDDVGIGDDVPITFRANDMRVRHALIHILRNIELTWVCRNHALVITTPDEADDMLLTMAYPVADLLGKKLGTDMFGDPQRLASHDDVIDLLTSVVAPQTWDDVGGPGSFEFCPHIAVLVVSQAPDVHGHVADLLGKVRRHLAECQASPGTSVAPQGADATRLVIYSVPTAPSNTAQSSSVKSAPKGSVGQVGDAIAAGAPLAQFGGMGGGTSGTGGVSVQVVIPEGELLTLIMDLIEPASWRERDDVYARAVPGSLVIRHTDAVHKQIGKLLGRLNARRPAPSATYMGGGGGGFF
ncbi:MAG: hypothetical protein H8E44_27880 [Planctomycetes bacterium]|nr:hypothetical protein [Planctomycetota bacterium]MBL7039325.1 hypothetical protein [Pirellulaceae bacterium]